eukprot:gene7239-5088_t
MVRKKDTNHFLFIDGVHECIPIIFGPHPNTETMTQNHPLRNAALTLFFFNFVRVR